MRARTVAASTLVLAAVLAGCGHVHTPTDSDTGTTGTSAAATAGVNSADQMFVTMMIPHHEQAIEMADIILAADGVDQEVVDLAQQIKDAQGPEIETMTGWLTDWGTPYDPDAADSMGDMGHGGMMSDDEMTALSQASGDEAARLFLEGMIAHHEGAIEMAQTEIDDGENAEVIALAEQVVSSQGTEIETMQTLLEGLSG